MRDSCLQPDLLCKNQGLCYLRHSHLATGQCHDNFSPNSTDASCRSSSANRMLVLSTSQPENRFRWSISLVSRDSNASWRRLLASSRAFRRVRRHRPIRSEGSSPPRWWTIVRLTMAWTIATQSASRQTRHWHFYGHDRFAPTILR